MGKKSREIEPKPVSPFSTMDWKRSVEEPDLQEQRGQWFQPSNTAGSTTVVYRFPRLRDILRPRTRKVVGAGVVALAVMGGAYAKYGDHNQGECITSVLLDSANDQMQLCVDRGQVVKGDGGQIGAPVKIVSKNDTTLGDLLGDKAPENLRALALEDAAYILLPALPDGSCTTETGRVANHVKDNAGMYDTSDSGQPSSVREEEIAVANPLILFSYVNDAEIKIITC